MKKLLSFVLLLFSIFVFTSCDDENTNIEIKAKEDLTIVYTNDIHSYIANTKKVDSNTVPGLRLNNISAYVKDLKKNNQNVLLVDAGDEIQGSIYGSVDNGLDVIDIMNEAGYDLATPGNHDFDYGVSGFFSAKERAKYPFISCNFKTIDDTRLLDDYKIFDIAGFKIGFVGVSTPETITQSTPTYFQNENKEFIYKFDGQSDKNDLYNTFQESVDKIRNDVDYVIALGHLGVGYDAELYGIRSIDLINNTTGVDAFIDGHSHTLIEKDYIKSKDDKDVLLTQTGCYLDGVGVMTISKDGILDTKIKNDFELVDNKVKALEDKLIDKVTSELGKTIAVLDHKLYTNNSEIPTQRIVRARETNLGDFSADSVYWYINEVKELDCDIAICNGGGIRTEIDAGAVTYMNAKNVMPYGNQVCLIKTTGKIIKDALELGSFACGGWDTKDNRPAESGGFLQVGGLKYTIDASIETSVKTENGLFQSVDGEYKVKDIMVYNKKTNSYEELDLNKEYTVGGINYILRNNGNGYSMFSNANLVLDYIGEDYQILAEYMKSFTKDNQIRINNSNCPLNKYTNFQIDYENPRGAGRINIINLNTEV